MKNEFLKIFGCSEITNRTLLKILRDLEIDTNSSKDEINLSTNSSKNEINLSTSSYKNEINLSTNSYKDENILFYKVLEKVLLDYYKTNLEIDISNKVYSKEEIIGLLAFLYIRKYNLETLELLETTLPLSTFFDSLFFSKSSESAIKELKEENEKLKNEEAKKTQLEYHNLDNLDNLEHVDYEVLKKLEKENLELKRIIKYENDVIIKAWYGLCEEHIKRNL